MCILYRKLHCKEIMSLSMVLVVLAFFTGWFSPKVAAEASISQLSPAEGPVGTVVLVTGQISTENGSYTIFFDDAQVKNGSASIYEVSDTFTVPNATSGNHPVKLQDVSTGENGTLNFNVQTRFAIRTSEPTLPKQLQEGSNITIVATVTGGNATTFANLTVEDPANVTHSSNVTIPINGDGRGEANITYPTDFDKNPHTLYVGTYNVSLNTLNETLATGNFTVGLTDAAEYYRFQTVYIQALNYTTTDTLKITITHDDETVFESPPRNASEPRGKIAANWTIPANATIGPYTVDVINVTTPLSTEKLVPDNQTFMIVSKSFFCEVKAFNLVDEPVEGIVVEANNTATSAVNTNTTNKDGLAFFYLEAANYSFTAFLNNTEVGVTPEISLAGNLTGATAPNITCSLTHIRAAVRDEEGNMLPFVRVTANYTYNTRTNTTISKTATTETNLTGLATLRNLFTNINYTVEASRYDQTFSTSTLYLTSARWVNTTCPNRELIVQVFDRSGSPLQNAQVTVYDWGIGVGGSVGVGNTDANGAVVFSLTFGKYTVKVYKNDLLLNETSTLLVSQPTNFAVHCKLYNLTLSVKVLDYFGQGIPHANVTINRGAVHTSSSTGGDGLVQFTSLVGGTYKIFVYIGEKPIRITTIDFLEPKTVTLKVAEIVSIGGFVTETAQFVTITLIVLFVAVFLLAFAYRRLIPRQKEE